MNKKKVIWFAGLSVLLSSVVIVSSAMKNNLVLPEKLTPSRVGNESVSKDKTLLTSKEKEGFEEVGERSEKDPDPDILDGGSQKIDLLDENLRLIERLVMLQEQLAECEVRQEKCDDQIDEEKEVSRKLERKITALESAKKAAQEDKTNLQNEIDQKAADCENLKQEISELNNKMQLVITETSGLTQELESLRNIARQEKVDLQEKINQQVVDYERINKEMNSQQELSNAEKLILREEIESLKNLAAEEKQTLHNEISQKKSEHRQQLEEKVLELQTQERLFVQEKTNLQEELDIVKVKLEEDKSKMQRLELDQEVKIKALEDELKKAEEAQEENDKSFVVKEEKLKILEDELKKAEANQEEKLKAFEDELKKVKDQSDLYIRSNRILQDGADKFADKTKKTQVRIDNLNNDCKAYKEKIEKLEEQLEKKQ